MPTRNSSLNRNSASASMPTKNPSLNRNNKSMPTKNPSLNRNSASASMPTKNISALTAEKPIITNSFKNIKKSNESFKNRNHTDEEDDDSEYNEEFEVEYEEDSTINKSHHLKNSKKQDDEDFENTEENEDDEDFEDVEDVEDIEEGFNGSQTIEFHFFKKLLLALLITFIGYMIILSSNNNLIPITSYAPHLKQFKHLIYGSLFFIITYICLEVF